MVLMTIQNMVVVVTKNSRRLIYGIILIMSIRMLNQGVSIRLISVY